LDRIGTPSTRFASRGVYNVCLGPRAKVEALRGPRIVVAIFDKNDLVVRELREEHIQDDGSAVEAATGEPLGLSSCIVDVDLTGQTTVLHSDAKAVLGNRANWVELLDKWSLEYGVPQ
jgi:hypothetical protein